MHRVAFLVGVVAAAAVCSPTWGQSSVDRFERQMEQLQREQLLRVDTAIPAEQRALFDYGGYAAFNFFSIDDTAQRTHLLRQTEVSGYAHLNFDNVHEFFIRGDVRYEDFNAGDSFDGKGDDWVGPHLTRAFYRFDLRQYLAAYEGEASEFGLVLTGGRQLVHWASGLALDHELDGILAEASFGDLIVTGLAATTVPETLDFDGSRPSFEDDTRRAYFGGKIDWHPVAKHTVYVYGLYQHDHNSDNFDADPLRAQRRLGIAVPLLPTHFEYDSYYIGVGGQGNLTDQLAYSIEAVYEGGESLSNSFTLSGAGPPFVATPAVQTREDISAYAVSSQIDYLFHDANRTRATFALVAASGDSDRLSTSNTFGGNAGGTNDRAFNGLGLTYTGLAFAPQVSNLVMARVGVSTMPISQRPWFERLQLGANLFCYSKLNDNAPINEPTSDSHYLGTGIDLFVNWQVTSDVGLALRYGVFFPGTAITADHDARHFLFTGFTYAF
ncbi:MAG: hypothetical protein GC162_16270 [Planctomycetes bacterium]|nr:hypothetical protein [Planctomycetota bacterium]